MNFKSFFLKTACFGICLLTATCLYAKTGDELLVRKIEYQGLKNVSMDTVPQLAEIKNRAGRRLSQQDISLYINQLYVTGYFKSVKTNEVVSNNERILTFIMDENPVLTDVLVTGNRVFSELQLKPLISHKPGSLLNLSQLDNDKQTLEEFYSKKNYELMRVESIRLVTGNRLVFLISEGKVVSVNIVGLKEIQPYVLLREMKQFPGEIFNSRELREDREKWVRMGYFANVSAPQLKRVSTKNNEISVNFSLSERKNNVIDVGFEQEYSIIVAFLLGTLNHAFMHSDVLTGKVQFGNDNSNVYKITSYTVKYFQPWFLNQHRFSFTTDIWDESRKEFLGKDVTAQTLLNNRRQGQQISFGFPLIDETLVFSTRVKNENVTPLPGEDGFSEYSIRSLGFQLSYRTVTSLTNPKTGTYWTMDAERGGDIGFLDVGGLHFNRLSLNFGQFYPLGERDTLAFHTVLGAFYTTQSDISTFDTEAYTLGGSNSLRGFKETSPFIGTRKTLVNLELRHDFSDFFQGLLFIDWGRSFSTGADFFEPRDSHVGQGFGFRFYTPISPIRLDFAWAEQGLIIHFGLGQVF